MVHSLASWLHTIVMFPGRLWNGSYGLTGLLYSMCSDDDSAEVMRFEAGPEWVCHFAVTTRPHLGSMSASQLQQLIQTVS